ncbi:monovalent cation/H+ antiporter subunit A [Variovorax dokdonensis]|uniref:Monovalent cation/H+ antiporter subunit A n=1 Tax=Variovorax dokdonensis TaxID=344883 RepID=A0ABT7NC15_9BURK|nr:monovalent cation/H+ antiporter subunit A [Variovorax dokdonensis]MDM0045496.1 monovalent cation/H+ antiporter subunit A [Variovorax dokdonensis]
MALLLIVVLPFVASLFAALMPHDARNRESTLAGLVALGLTVQMALLFPQVSGGQIIDMRVEWIPVLGLEFHLRLDGFAWMFAMLVLGIGSLVVLYARYYMSPSDPVPRFFSFFLAFMGAMLGVVLSGNLIQMVVFWELTSLFSFLLIGYWHHRRDARRGARMALTVTGAGGLCLLGGVLLLGRITGSYELEAVLAAGEKIRASTLYLPALGLVLLGAFTKSAQFPFHFWLPRAMAAPTPVSAYLHSATMVKLGVFLLARLWPSLSGTEAWFRAVSGAGVCTMLLGGYAAMYQRDLKGLLAYSTISHLGLIVLLLGLNSPLAAVAAVFHVMNHATFKASLFMAAGIIDHETGTRDINKLSGLIGPMPITATLAIIASAAMAGVPLLNGFISKEMFFAETTFIQASRWVELGLPLAATVAGMFSVAYSLRLVVDVFFGPPCNDQVPRPPHEPPHWMRVPSEILVVLCLVVGIVPAWSVGPLLAAAAAPVVGGTLPEYELALWHGFNMALLMSVLALVGGTLIYLVQRALRARGHLDTAPLLRHFDGQRIFENALARLSEAGRRSRRILGTRRLQPQLTVMAALAVLGPLAVLWYMPPFGEKAALLPFSPMFAMLWVIGGTCAVMAAVQAKFHRLAAIMLASGAGLICCVTFIWFSAPDLALTQLIAEVVTTVLLLLGLRWLPLRRETAPPAGTPWRRFGRRTRDLVIAVSAGTGLAALSWTMMTRPFPQSISGFFLDNALTQGGGTNVVNVMLVDFRGFDTFGEICVLGIVALTVYALLRRFRPAVESMALPPQQLAAPDDGATDLLNPRLAHDTAVGYLMVPAVLVRLLLPLSVLVSVYFFMRGHNQPGGGFVAGLVMSVALLLQYIVSGAEWVEEHLRIFPRRWIATGLLLALATGGGAVVLGFPFMTTHTAHFSLPVLGDIHVPSALFFDIGVFSLVLGATMLILTALAHQSIRSHRWAEEQAERAEREAAEGASA